MSYKTGTEEQTNKNLKMWTASLTLHVHQFADSYQVRYLNSQESTSSVYYG